MPHYHPNDNILTEFAAGTLPVAQAVAVNAHLHYCAHCRRAVSRLEVIGGALLEELTPKALTENSFDDLMARIDAPSHSQQEKPYTEPAAEIYRQLPSVVANLMDHRKLKWRKVNRTLHSATLAVGQKQYEVSLQRIKAGECVPEHDHRGLEITVVLEGSFSDKQGIYQAGDFMVKEPGEVHQPISAQHQDCLCLAIQESPVKLTGLFGKIINPFIKLHAA